MSETNPDAAEEKSSKETLKVEFGALGLFVRTAPAEQIKALEAAAIPHWFDDRILGTLLDDDLRPNADELFKAVIALPYCEAYQVRNGYNIKKAFRQEVRSQLRSDAERFKQLTARAAEAFDGDSEHGRVEKVYHQLWGDPGNAGLAILSLALEVRTSPNAGPSVAAVFRECLADDDSVPSLVTAWACWIQAVFSGPLLKRSERLSLARRCDDLAALADSDLARAAAAELRADILCEDPEANSQQEALELYGYSVRLLTSLTLKGPDETLLSQKLFTLRRKMAQLQDKPAAFSLAKQVDESPHGAAPAPGNVGQPDVGEPQHARFLSGQVAVFISAVTTEFASYRSRAREALSARDFWVETQESFLAFGDTTLVELSNYIRSCDAVVQLHGDQSGKRASRASQDALLSAHPNLPSELDLGESFLRKLSYTQWEAWLAILHGKRLYLAAADPKTVPDAPAQHETGHFDVVSSSQHLAALREHGHYPSPQLTFVDSDGLVIALLRNLRQLLERDRLEEAIGKLNDRFSMVTNSELINDGIIDRREAEDVLDAVTADGGSGVLLVAGAGYGKSCIIAQVIAELTAQEIPFAAFKLDSVPECSSADRLGEHLELQGSPVDVLAKVAAGAPSVLIVDQLDAISTVSGRKTNTWTAFEELRKAAKSANGMKLIVACRDFDLQQDHRLRPLGSDNSGYRKVTVGKLDKSDVRIALDSAGLRDFKPSDRQVEILSLPFHLVLFLQGYPERPFSRIGELYDAYWERKTSAFRDEGGADSEWNSTIDTLTSYMSSHRTTAVPPARMEDHRHAARMMVSANMLVESSYGYQFFHESFFDYAYARRFCSRGQSLVDFLTADGEEQHLFRRAQVRQILGYRRENDHQQYYADLREVLASDQVRFHIRRMVASELNRVTEPSVKEWEIIEPILSDEDRLSGYVLMALRNHVGWFDLLNAMGVWNRWLNSGEQEVVQRAIWFLSAHELHKDRSANVAELLAPFVSVGGEWDERLKSVLSWGVAHLSTEMTEVYFALVDRGVYDAEDGDRSGRDFWGNHYDAEENNPRFIVDLVRLWLSRAIEKYDDGKSWNFLDSCSLNKSRTGSQLIRSAVSAERDYFVDQLLPVVVDGVLKTETQSYDRLLNRAWPYLSNHGDPFDVNDAVLVYLRQALEEIAKANSEAFQTIVQPLKRHHHETICYLVLSAFAANPRAFANDCIEYMLDHKPRLNIGYGSWSGGEGHGESAVSRMAVRAVTPICDEAHLRSLEEAVIGYCDEYEKSTPSRRGFAELLVLRSICVDRRSQRVNVRISELECSFPNITDHLPPANNGALLSCVGSPIDPERATHMTDANWISAMSKYDGSTDRFAGGPVELSRMLSDFTRGERVRFAELALKMPASIDGMYFSAILDGMTSRGTNLKADKEEEEAKVAALSTELFTAVMRRLHSLPEKPCGTAIVHCIQRLAERELPDELLNMVTYYATEDPDPTEDIWQRDNYYGGDPHHHGINCVRGQAAETLGSLLYGNKSRLEALRPALLKVTSDQIVSVRTCAIRGLTALLNFARDEAVELFISCCRDVPRIWSTDPFEHFIHYAMRTHFAQLHEFLVTVLESADDNAVEKLSRRIILADLGGVDTSGEAERIRTGSEPMRRAAAHIYAHNIGQDEEIGERACRYLRLYLDDESEAVLREVALGFANLSGEALLRLEQLVSEFVECPAFEHEPEYFLRSLEESRVELPHVICRAAERVLDFLGEEGTSIAHRGALAASSVSKLIVRQYAQTEKDDLKRHCLDRNHSAAWD